RKEVAKRLAEAIAVTTDPKQLAELSRQFNTLSRLRKGKRVRRNTDAATPSQKNRSLREIYTGSVYEVMSDGELVLNHLVLQIEKRQKAGELKTEAERDVFIKEMLGHLPENECAAYERLERESVA